MTSAPAIDVAVSDSPVPLTNEYVMSSAGSSSSDDLELLEAQAEAAAARLRLAEARNKKKKSARGSSSRASLSSQSLASTPPGPVPDGRLGEFPPNALAESNLLPISEGVPRVMANHGDGSTTWWRQLWPQNRHADPPVSQEPGHHRGGDDHEHHRRAHDRRQQHRVDQEGLLEGIFETPSFVTNDRRDELGDRRDQHRHPASGVGSLS